MKKEEQTVKIEGKTNVAKKYWCEEINYDDCFNDNFVSTNLVPGCIIYIIYRKKVVGVIVYTVTFSIESKYNYLTFVQEWPDGEFRRSGMANLNGLGKAFFLTREDAEIALASGDYIVI